MSLSRNLKVFSFVAGAFALGLAACRAQDPFTHWPPGASPGEVGKRVAERLWETRLDFQNRRVEDTFYPEVVSWYGALTFANLSGDQPLQSKLIGKFDFFLTPEGEKKISQQAHVDFRVFGAVPLQIYLLSKEPKYLFPGKSLADKQWEPSTPGGLSPETRYWIDDMYMITLLQLQAYRATGDKKYLDRTACEMVAYLDKLQQPNGLFFHAPDVPFYWGRGNGWFAAGMAELLSELPPDHPRRARIMRGYRKMMASLLTYQSEDGAWRQLIDRPESWPESSCTGMFAFAMITGVKAGWLDQKTFAPAARKGWLAVVDFLNGHSDIRDVCVGTNKENSLEYYQNRKRITGDLHGQAPVLWCASALLK